MQKPPTKGYVHWDKGTFERLRQRHARAARVALRGHARHAAQRAAERDGERGGGYRRLVAADRALARQRTRTSAQPRRTARGAASGRCARAGIVDVVHDEAARGRLVEVSAGPAARLLAEPHALALPARHAASCSTRRAETYALDVLTLVESILENPDVVLYAQLDQLKGEKIAEMKAAGIEYDERMAELEKLE